MADTQENAPAPAPVQLVSSKEILIKVLVRSFLQAASYDFSWMIAVLPFLIADEDDLAALPLILTILSLVVGGEQLFLFAVRRMISEKFGRLEDLQKEEGREEECAELRQEIARAFRDQMIMVPPVGLAMAPALVYSGNMLVLFGQSENIAQIAQNYLRPYAWVLPGLLSRVVFEQVLLGLEKAPIAMFIGLGSFLVSTVVASLVNSAGLEAIAYAYVFGGYLTCAGFGLYLFFYKDFADYHFFSCHCFDQDDWKRLKELFKTGFAYFLTMVNEYASLFAISLLMANLGEDQSSAQAFSSAFLSLSLILVWALSQTVSQYVGKAIGAGEYGNAHRFAVRGLASGMLLMGLPCLLFAAYPELMTYLVAAAPGEKVISLALPLIRIQAAAVFLGDTPRYLMLIALREIKHNFLPTAASGICLWLGVGLAAVFKEKGPEGIIGGYALGMVLGALILVPLFCREFKPASLASSEGSETPTSSGRSCLSFLRGIWGAEEFVVMETMSAGRRTPALVESDVVEMTGRESAIML